MLSEKNCVKDFRRHRCIKAGSIDILPGRLFKDVVSVPAKLSAYVDSFPMSFNKFSSVFKLTKVKFPFFSKLVSEPCQTSKVERFANIVNGF